MYWLHVPYKDGVRNIEYMYSTCDGTYIAQVVGH